MNLSLLLLFFTHAEVVTGQALPGKLYINPQYGYSFWLPAELVASPGRVGDLTLSSRDGNATLRISSMSESRPGFPGNDPDHEGQADAGDCDQLPASYVLRKPSVVAFSCRKGADIRYDLTRYTKTGSVTMEATYRWSERAHWDPLISRLASSLKRTR